MGQFRSLLRGFALVLVLLAVGPVLAWAAQNQLGPAIVAVVIAARATPPQLPAPVPALAAPFSPEALLRSLLATEVR